MQQIVNIILNNKITSNMITQGYSWDEAEINFRNWRRGLIIFDRSLETEIIVSIFFFFRYKTMASLNEVCRKAMDYLQILGMLYTDYYKKDNLQQKKESTPKKLSSYDRGKEFLWNNEEKNMDLFLGFLK